MRQKNCLGYPGLSWEGRDPTGTPAESYERARSEDTHTWAFSVSVRQETSTTGE